MNTKNLKTVLEAIRAMVMKNRAAYKDYLGTETVTKVLAEGVCESGGTDLVTKDSGFTGFVAGQTYTVTIDGEASDWVAKSCAGSCGIGTAVDYYIQHGAWPTDNTGIWAIRYYTTKNTGEKAVGLVVMDESYSGKKIVVSQTVTQKKYDIKKLPEELLPDNIAQNSHTHANKDVLDEITDDLLDYWDNKSDFSGSYNDLTDKPTLFSGSYNDLTDKPTQSGAVQKIESTDQSNPVVLRTLASGAYILNGYFKTYAGMTYVDVSISDDQFAIVQNNDSATYIQLLSPNDHVIQYYKITDTTKSGKYVSLDNIVQSDWTQDDTTKFDYIKNRPFYDGTQYLFVDRSKTASLAVTSSNGTFCKVSDIVVKPDQTLNLVWYNTFGSPSAIQSGSNKITTTSNTVAYAYSADTTNMTIVFASAANAGPINSTVTDTFPSPGIYFPVDTTIESMEGEVSYLKKIDNKFLDLSAYATKDYVDNLIANLKKSE